MTVILAAGNAACTDPVARRASMVEAAIDADTIVRKETVRVEVDIEVQQTSRAGWENIKHQTFWAETTPLEWPLEITLSNVMAPAQGFFSLVASAHDKQGAVIALSQTIRASSESAKPGLRVVFDAKCYRRSELCEYGTTCMFGECVNARTQQPTSMSSSSGEPDDPESSDEEDETYVATGVAVLGAACSKAGTRACADHGSRNPLVCDQGAWKSDSPCAQDQRCDSAAGPLRGQCKPIARECQNQEPQVPYCDGEAMFVCTDLVAAVQRPCSEHMRCVPNPEDASVECACLPGFVSDGADKCREATDCGGKNGGCDSLTTCMMNAGKPICTACPDGYSGTGAAGCAPLLQSLTLSAGELKQPIAATVFAYRIEVPIVAQRIGIMATVPQGALVKLNADSVAPGEQWTSPILPIGETSIDLVVTSEFGVTSRYELTVERTGSQMSYVKASNPDAGDWFGVALAITGDTLVVGSYYEDSASRFGDPDQSSNAANESGSAYVFARKDGSWEQQAYLKPDDTASNDFFGTSAAIEGDTIAIGAVHSSLLDGPTTGDPPGEAFIYSRKAGVWSLDQRLTASNPGVGDVFGASIGLSGTTLAVGACFGGATDAARDGAIYMFERDGAVWKEAQIVVASVQGSDSYFGWSLAIEGDRMVVGAPEDDAPESNTGSAYVYERRAGKWTQIDRLQPTGIGGGAYFGTSVALHGTRIAIGAPRSNFPADTVLTGASKPPGEVYLYDLDGDHYRQTAVLRAPNSRDTDLFGSAVALSAFGLAVGASGDGSNARGVNGDDENSGARGAGAAYLFALGPEGWKSTAYLKPNNTGSNDAFAYRLAMTDDALAVGAPLESGTARGVDGSGTNGAALNSGAVYVFR